MKILFVGLGNVCRSPMAEALLRKKFLEYGIKGEVASAGFESFLINEPPDPRVIELGKQKGIEITGNCKLFKQQYFDKYDKIYVMDTQNYRDVKDLARNQLDLSKIDYLMNVFEPGKNKTIPDPLMSGLDDFETVFKMLDNVTDKILQFAIVPEQN